MYRHLDSDRLVETCRALHQRIAERFPASGLSRVATELLEVAQEAAALHDWLAKPHLPLRILAGIGIVALVFVVCGVFYSVEIHLTFGTITELLQSLESAINEIAFLGVAIFFLLTLENRRKRRRALKAIHVLRSFAHIIDMHQLSKDPEHLLRRGPDTPASPKRTLTPFELTRYLDYCSELLALISKLAALYVQRFDDPVTLSSVNDVEELTNGLSRKIWQKIMILDRILVPEGQPPAPKAPSHGPA